MIGVDCVDTRERRAHAALADRAAVPEPARLPESDAAGHALLPGGAAARRADARARLARSRDTLGGLIVLSGGRRGRYRPRAARASATMRRSAASMPGSTLFGDRFYLEAAAHRRAPASEYLHGRPARAGGARGVAARRDQRCALPAARRFRGPRGAGVHSRWRPARRSRPRAPLQRGAVPDIAGAKWRQLFADVPEAAGQHRRDREALLARAQARQPRCCRPIRCRPAARPRPTSCASRPRRACRPAGVRVRRRIRRAGPRITGSGCDLELGVICPMGFAGYFLIVADFIRWARENGVPVGPGRGSGAGSLVAYVARHHRSRSD